jgi:PAS domain S-box-containing protein
LANDLTPSPGLRSRPPAAASPQALLDRLELAAIALDRTSMPMAVTDPRQPDNPIVLANQAFLTLTGYGAHEVVGRNCRFLQGKETSAQAIAEIRSAVAEPKDVTVELLNYRKDGTEFWNRLYVSPIYGDEGELLYFFASQDDVTDFRRMQALELTERRLLKEVDHRARNVLAVVSGIVRLSRSDDAAVYAASIQKRVHALAAAHTLLAERGWQEVALDQIVRQQLNLLSSHRIAIEGPEVMVSSFVVQPLALVIQELLINATLHGVLSGAEGTLTIGWVALEDRGGFELTWEEAGGPAPPEIQRPGFGTAITRGMIEKQLRGTVRREWTDTGLLVTINVPTGRDPARPAPSA